MGAVFLRLVLLAIGIGAVEIGLGSALFDGSLVGWGLVLLLGLPLIVAGSAGFMVPLFSAGQRGGSSHA